MPFSTQIQRKICLLGVNGVGKTSLINRYIFDRFEEHLSPSMGVKISRKEVVWRELPVNLLIWDIADGEEMAAMELSYLQGVSGIFLVCDLTRFESVTKLPQYVANLQGISADLPVVVIGNKIDLVEMRQVPEDILARMANNWNAPYLLTSAKTGEKIDQAFQALVDLIVPSTRKDYD